MSNKSSNPYFLFRLCEFCLGAVCFGLFAYYFILIDTGGNISTPLDIVKYGICFVAADAFPFLVQIPFLIAYFHHGQSFQHNILNPIANLVGAIVYLTSGTLSLIAIAWPMYDYFSKAYTALAGMLVVTGIVYLLDFFLWIAKYRRDPLM